MKLASGKNVEEALYAFLGFDVGFRVQALTTQQSGKEPQQGEVLAGHLCGHTIVRWGTLYEASSEPPQSPRLLSVLFPKSRAFLPTAHGDRLKNTM